MRTNFFGTNFLNTAKGPGHPGKIPGTPRIPLFETQGRQSFEGGHEVFGHHPFAWKTPTPPGGLRAQKLSLCALFSCLINERKLFLHSVVRELFGSWTSVRAENPGRPHPKVFSSATRWWGENFLTQGHPGVRVRNVRRKSGPNDLCLCCFFSSLKPCRSGGNR